MNFQNLTFNLRGPIRHETLEGRDHLVVATVMIVEGVLNGSSGALLYPGEELARGISAWNHKPIVVGHPTTGTACDPLVINSRKVGVLLNTRWDAPKLRTEAWLDIGRCNRIDGRIIDDLHCGKKIEVSTGLYVDQEQLNGQWKGKQFDSVARNYRPDHLAILPDTVGACSIADGAGMLQTNALHYPFPVMPSYSAPLYEEQPYLMPTINFSPGGREINNANTAQQICPATGDDEPYTMPKLF